MKKLAILFISCFLTVTSFSQVKNKPELPEFYVVNGDTLGIILSIEQVQKIDNDLEIKNLLELALIDCDSLSSQWIVVTNKYEKQIYALEVKNSELLTANSLQKQISDQLKAKCDNCETDLKLCNEQSIKKDKIISNQKSTINKLKLGGGALNLTLLIIIVALAL